MTTSFRPVVKRTYGTKKRLSNSSVFSDTSRGSNSSEWEGITDPDSSFTSQRDEIETPSTSPRSESKGKAKESTGRILRDSTTTNLPKRRSNESSSPIIDDCDLPSTDLRSFFSKISPKKRQRNENDRDDSYSTSQRASIIASTSKLPSGSKSRRLKPLEQLYLDPFTTTSHSTITCPICTMSYARTPSDILLHDKHHKKVIGGCDWISHEKEIENPECIEIGTCIEWSKETGGRILMVNAVAEGALGKRINDIIGMIDLELSATSLPASVVQESKLIILVTKRKKVVAAALVQRIESAFQVVSSTVERGEDLMRFGEEEGAVFCSPIPTPTRIGIHRIYTSPTHRRFSLASILLDAIASRFIYGCPITQANRKEDVAFSQPTGAGMSLARNWTGTNSFKVFVE